MTTPDNALRDTRAKIDALAARIANARASIANRRAVDLAGMEDEVEAVCLMVRAPGPSADEQVRTSLGALLADLNALETELTEQRDLMVGNSQETIAPNVAASAYGRTKS